MAHVQQFKNGFWLAFDSLKMIWRHKRLLGYGMIGVVRYALGVMGVLNLNMQSTWPTIVLSLGVIWICLIIGIFAQAGIVLYSSSVMKNKGEWTVKQVWQQVVSKIKPQMLWGTISIITVIGPGAGTFTFIWRFFMFFVMPILMLENSGVLQAMKRSELML